MIFQTVGRPWYPNLYQQISRVAYIWRISSQHHIFILTDWLQFICVKSSRKINGWEDPCIGWDVLTLGRRIIGAPVHWLIDLRPRNRGFYTGLMELPKLHRISKGMSGLLSSVEALHIKKSQKPPCLIKDPWGRRLWIFSSRIFCSDFINEFLHLKSLLRDHEGAKVSLAKFQSRSNFK